MATFEAKESDVIKVGAVFTGKWFKGRIEILSIDESKDEGLKVYLTNENGSSWEEDWNLSVVRVGLETGDYFFTCCETCNGTGKVRANYTNKEGKYVFHKAVCHECHGDLCSRMEDFGKE